MDYKVQFIPQQLRNISARYGMRIMH
jgi:hypothetical protein